MAQIKPQSVAISLCCRPSPSGLCPSIEYRNSDSKSPIESYLKRRQQRKMGKKGNDGGTSFSPKLHHHRLAALPSIMKHGIETNASRSEWHSADLRLRRIARAAPHHELEVPIDVLKLDAYVCPCIQTPGFSKVGQVCRQRCE